jgi:hypothetical protein
VWFLTSARQLNRPARLPAARKVTRRATTLAVRYATVGDLAGRRKLLVDWTLSPTRRLAMPAIAAVRARSGGWTAKLLVGLGL